MAMSATTAAVLQTLSEARLITQDEGVVEVAHEALIREWPTLRQWLSEDREGLRLHRRLTEDAQEWEALERDPSTSVNALQRRQDRPPRHAGCARLPERHQGGGVQSRKPRACQGQHPWAGRLFQRRELALV